MRASVATPVEEVLQELLEEQLEGIEAHIVSFACADFPAYAHACGKREGIWTALGMISEAQRKAEERENE